MNTLLLSILLSKILLTYSEIIYINLIFITYNLFIGKTKYSIVTE